MTNSNSEAIALLTNALNQGLAVTLSLAAPPQVDRVPALVTTCSLRLGMTESEARVLVELTEHGYVTREALHAAMGRAGKVSKIGTLGVVVCRVRAKLKSRGIAIENIWGQGFRINESDRDRIRELLADHGAGSAGAHEPNVKPAT